jgi:PASTA domain
MRGSSGRLAIAAAVVLGVGVLAVIGRLLPVTSSVRSSATGPRPAPAIRTAPGNTRGYGVPNVLGRTLAQAERVLRTGGLRGAAIEGDPLGSSAIVVAQEPPAGATVPPGSLVGLRTRTDIWPNGTSYHMRLWHGPTTATYRIVAANPADEALTVVVTMLPAVDLRIWLHTRQARRVMVDITAGSESCRPVNRGVQCLFAFGALGGEEPGVWTVGVAKRSVRPAAIQIKVTFARP